MEEMKNGNGKEAPEFPSDVKKPLDHYSLNFCIKRRSGALKGIFEECFSSSETNMGNSVAFEKHVMTYIENSFLLNYLLPSYEIPHLIANHRKFLIVISLAPVSEMFSESPVFNQVQSWSRKTNTFE